MAYSITIDVPTMFHVAFSITIIVRLSSKTALCCKTRQGQRGVAGDYAAGSGELPTGREKEGDDTDCLPGGLGPASAEGTRVLEGGPQPP